MSDAATTSRRSRTSEQVTIGGLQLHYLDWGNAAAPPLVCVHGYTGSADAFNGFARHFRDRFHIVALDVRGHGESAWSPQRRLHLSRPGRRSCSLRRPARPRPIHPARHLDGRHHRDDLCDGAPRAAAGTGAERRRAGCRNTGASASRRWSEAGRTCSRHWTTRWPIAAKLRRSSPGATPPTNANWRLACCDSDQTVNGVGKWTRPIFASASNAARLSAPTCGRRCCSWPVRPWSYGGPTATCYRRRRRSAW